MSFWVEGDLCAGDSWIGFLCRLDGWTTKEVLGGLATYALSNNKPKQRNSQLAIRGQSSPFPLEVIILKRFSTNRSLVFCPRRAALLPLAATYLKSQTYTIIQFQCVTAHQKGCFDEYDGAVANVRYMYERTCIDSTVT